MREILFRGKRIDNGKWVVGMLARYNSKFNTANMVDEFEILVPVISETVGQYTGLTDKNGKKIFEGDIVKDEQVQLFSKVVYATSQDGFDGISGFMVDDIDDGMQNYNGFWHLVEIIGNIHDNPELLKGGADNA